MTMQDPLADMLTRIRNAQRASIERISLPVSKMKLSVLKVLKEEGYISDYAVEEGEKRDVSVDLKYFQGRPVIEEIKSISRPGLRRYSKKDKIPLVRGGLGIVILSTNRGVITDRAARANGVGGELLCTVF